jgi:hypothetical protein
MTARLLMTPEQVAAAPDAWKARRRRTPDGRWCVTASEIPLVCGIAPPTWGGPYKLYHAKLSGTELVRDTDEMRRGHALERLVLDDFRDMYSGLAVLPGGLYAHGGDDRWLATFDSQVTELGTFATVTNVAAPLEQLALDGREWEIWPGQVKTSIPTEGYGWEEDSTDIPDHNRAQLLWEMFVRGSSLGFLIVKFMRSWNTRVYQIERDAQAEAEIAWMLNEAELFCKRLETGDEPPVDWFPATTATLRRQYPGIEDRAARIPWWLALQYKAAIKASAALKERRGMITNQILHRAGNAGTIVAREWNTGRVVKVATRTASEPVPEHTAIVKAKDRVDRLNPCGWAKARGQS